MLLNIKRYQVVTKTEILFLLDITMISKDSCWLYLKVFIEIEQISYTILLSLSKNRLSNIIYNEIFLNLCYLLQFRERLQELQVSNVRNITLSKQIKLHFILIQL